MARKREVAVKAHTRYLQVSGTQMSKAVEVRACVRGRPGEPTKSNPWGKIILPQARRLGDVWDVKTKRGAVSYFATEKAAEAYAAHLGDDKVEWVSTVWVC